MAKYGYVRLLFECSKSDLQQMNALPGVEEVEYPEKDFGDLLASLSFAGKDFIF